MSIFKKRKKEKIIINSKYQIGDHVHFRYKDEVRPGHIYDIRLNKADEVVYDIQIGGECPVVIENIPENKIFVIKK